MHAWQSHATKQTGSAEGSASKSPFAAVPDPAALGVAPGVLAFACMLGWGVGVGMTPMSASAIATARWSDSDPWTVTTRWNAGFTAWALALASAAIVLADVVS